MNQVIFYLRGLMTTFLRTINVQKKIKRKENIVNVHDKRAIHSQTLLSVRRRRCCCRCCCRCCRLSNPLPSCDRVRTTGPMSEKFTAGKIYCV